MWGELHFPPLDAGGFAREFRRYDKMAFETAAGGTRPPQAERKSPVKTRKPPFVLRSRLSVWAASRSTCSPWMNWRAKPLDCVAKEDGRLVGAVATHRDAVALRASTFERE